MNGVRRLWGVAASAATTTTSTTLEQQPSPVYDTNPNTNWTPQSTFASSSTNPGRPTRTPSPPAQTHQSSYPKLTIANGSSPIRVPSRQNSSPASPDDQRAPSRGTNYSVHSRTSSTKNKALPTHSKAISSLSRSTVNGYATPPLPGASAMGGTTKDELIIELLASEAVVDSREYEILGAEQVEELKKELKSLSTRVNAASKKVQTETKIRDAALALNKIHKKSPSKGANGLTTAGGSLENAERKVQNAQFELTKLQEQYNRVHQRLLEHRSAVLSYSLNRLESLVKGPTAGSDPGSGRTTPANQSISLNGLAGGDFSPTSAVTNMSMASRAKFEGAHLFAGHQDAKAPPMPKQMRSIAQMSAMEDQLGSVEDALKEAKAEQESLRREFEDLQRQKAIVENELSSKAQEADNTIFGLRSELERMNSTSKRVRQLEDEKRKWEDQQMRLERELKDTQMSANVKADLDAKESELRELRALLEEERAEREEERQAWEDQKLDDMARLQAEMDEQREREAEAARSADVELDMVSERLQALIRTHGIQLSPSQRRDMSVLNLANALSSHLDSTKDGKMGNRERDEWEKTKRKLEMDLSASLDRRDRLSQEVEEARQEREAARNKVRALEEQLREANDRAERPVPSKSNSMHSEPGSSNGSRTSDDIDRVMATLRNLWILLPSREARAAKSNARGGAPSPTSPLRTARLGEPPSPALADLDVRALKALYDPRNNATSPLFSNHSTPSEFSIDAFAARVQALVSDDRAIIERLLRFAQAHDLLKGNAERAQKLAQESSMGLETYQKQVKALEERNGTLVTKQSDLLDEINSLQGKVEQIQKERRLLELDAQDAAGTVQNLQDANATLSAKALALAEEVTTAPESMRIKMEAQLTEVRRQLKESLDELEAMRSSDTSQKAALLEELNVVQGEVIKLREELRTEKRKNGGK